jgi:hypothetical protein
MRDINETLLREVHEKYLRQRERIYLPPRQIGDRSSENRFRASRLYGCSIADHYSRTGMRHTHPHSYSLLQRFEQGNRVAEAWQEAFVWARRQPEYDWMRVEYEKPLESETLVGQADLVVNDIPIEIKNTVRYEVFGGHLLQLMAYCHLMNAPYGLLVYQNDFKNSIYRVDSRPELVQEAMARMAIADAKPTDIWELRPGLCTMETEMTDIMPREAKRANSKTGAVKGDIVPGTGTVKCQFFGHCFPWIGDKRSFLTHATKEQYDQGLVGAVTPKDTDHEQGS